MQVIIGKYSGFCFGVKKAIETAIALNGEDKYVLGELIHNEQVNQNLQKNGVKIIESVDEIESGTLVIRTHGESKETFRKLAEKEINVVDCTCPFVKKIQKIVDEYYKKGYQVIILGDETHPEVKGINGWCDDTAVVTSTGEGLTLEEGKKYVIVAQTTFSKEKYDKIIKNIKKDSKKTVEIFETICYTTIQRQEETKKMSKKVDAMIVIGGKNSNNTEKLAEISRKHIDKVFRITDPGELDYKGITKFKRVGIVLGASTPMEQAQEVISNMENITEVKTTINEEKEMEASAFKQEFDKLDGKVQKFRKGQVITATISRATDEGLDLYIANTKKEIALSKDEIINVYDKADYKDKIGDEIRVMIVDLNPVKLSEKAMVKVLKEEAEIEEIKNGKVFNVVIDGSNKGGLTGKFGSYQVFVPSSQIRIGFVNDLAKYVGKTLRVKAEKVEDKGRRQIVASQRVVLEAEKAERDAIRAEKEAAFFNSIAEGDVVRGTVVRFASFGAFVSVNGFDCLAHISDLSWSGCNNCADVLELNKTYEFQILKIDVEAKKVSIGYKQLQPKPWELVPTKYAVGDVVKGKVVRLVTFGAFVEVEKHVDGLVHVSQISNEWLENPLSVLKVGDEVEAKIIALEPEKEKMTLSIKALLPEVEKKPKAEKEDGEEKPKKKGRAKKEENPEDVELTEWKDDNGGASIAEILANIEE